jgi:hypothetical protein
MERPSRLVVKIILSEFLPHMLDLEIRIWYVDDIMGK